MTDKEKIKKLEAELADANDQLDKAATTVEELETAAKDHALTAKENARLKRELETAKAAGDSKYSAKVQKLIKEKMAAGLPQEDAERVAVAQEANDVAASK